MQRPDRMPLRAALIERARLREHVLAIEMGECLDLALDRVDARETGAGIVLGRDRTAGDFRRHLARGQRHEPVLGQSCAPASIHRQSV